MNGLLYRKKIVNTSIEISFEPAAAEEDELIEDIDDIEIDSSSYCKYHIYLA